MNLLLSEEKSVQLAERIFSSDLDFLYDPLKHRIEIFPVENKNQKESPVYFRLPITVPAPPIPADWQEKTLHYIILLIQSGQCAVGYFEGKSNPDHKVFRSYMVRKKQGKSQIKYLKTKGKSRAGSRVRLGETVEFFENINGRLKEYFETYDIDMVAMSCSKTLIPYLFNSKAETPFDKKDERIYKLPMHVNTPTYEILLDVQKFLLKGELMYEEKEENFLSDFGKGIL